MKKYTDFLNENSNEYENLKPDIIKVLDLFKGSFRKYGFIRDGEEEFKECLEEFKSDGIDIDYFMKKYIDKIMKDQDFTSNSGVADMLLYKYDKKHPLSGNLLKDDIQNSSSDEAEAMIKYDYGYHTLSLGKKYLFQTFKNLNEFFEQCAKEYGKQFYKYRLPYQQNGYGFDENDVKHYTSYTNENDIYIVNINFEGMYKDGYIDNLKSLKMKVGKELGDYKPTFYFDSHDNIVDIIGDLTDTSNKLLQEYKIDYEFYTGIQKYNL